MKIKKVFVSLALIMMTTSCGLAPVNKVAPTTTSVVSTTVSDNSKVGKIAQEIGYDNYMRGNWTSLDFTYEVKEIASVGVSIKYYVITFEYQVIGKGKREYYVKVTADGWEIMNQRSV